MSVTAHRVSEFKFEHSGLDLWNNEKFAEFLEKEEQFSSNLNSFGTGLIDIPIETLERAIRVSDLDIDEDTVVALNTDIALAKSARKEFVTYYCC